MGRDSTYLVFSFPPYPGYRIGADGKRRERPFLEWLNQKVSPWLGFQVWHKGGHGCETFPRGMDDYEAGAKRLIQDLEFRKSLDCVALTGTVGTVSLPQSVAVYQAIAFELERERRVHLHRRYGKKPNQRSYEKRMARSMHEAFELAACPVDNLRHVKEYDALVRLIAAALNRLHRSKWKHPNFHVHHWRVSFSFPHNFRRAFFDKCRVCKKSIGWGKSPVNDYTLGLRHTDCCPPPVDRDTDRLVEAFKYAPMSSPSTASDHVIH